MFFFQGVAKDFYSSSIINNFFVFGIDKGSVWIILFRVALLPTVVTCGVLYTYHCGETKKCWVIGRSSWDGYACIHDQSPFPCSWFDNIMLYMKKWETYIHILVDLIDIRYNFSCVPFYFRLVPDFGGHFLSYFGKEKD